MSFESFLKRQESINPYDNPFDIDNHNHIEYLEIIIKPEGDAYYAYPSHSEGLLRMYAEDQGVTREEVTDYIRKYNLDPVDYLTEVTGCTLVWYQGIMGPVNEIQLRLLKELRARGHYSGEV